MVSIRAKVSKFLQSDHRTLRSSSKASRCSISAETLRLPGIKIDLENNLGGIIMSIPWSRSMSVVKEVSRGHVLLKIPFHTIPVQDLKMESWQFYSSGNLLHVLLQREEKGCLFTQALEEKRKNFDCFLVYPGERLK